MSIVTAIRKTVEIQDGCLTQPLGIQMIQGDSLAHTIYLTVLDGGEAADLSGCTATGSFVRADGATATVAGTITGNVVSVPLDASCYAYTGEMTITVAVTNATLGITNTLFRANTSLRLGRTNAVVDPSGLIPNISELLTEVQGMRTATTAATTATSACEDATGDATDAAEAATTAAGSAASAAAAIMGMTAAANTLAAGSDATAAVSDVNGHKHISLGVPRGNTGATGERGAKWYVGSAISGTDTTPTTYATGISAAIIGDMYVNTNNSGSLGNVYRCTQGGAAASALWAYAGNIRGAAGSGDVSSVCDVSPDANGDVTLLGSSMAMSSADDRTVASAISELGTALTQHAGDTTNPHGVTLAQVGGAAAGHGHALTNAGITGVLAVEKGGTGATTAAAARAALGCGALLWEGALGIDGTATLAEGYAAYRLFAVVFSGGTLIPCLFDTSTTSTAQISFAQATTRHITLIVDLQLSSGGVLTMESASSLRHEYSGSHGSVNATTTNTISAVYGII